jgi:excisionase family DNA binding protein
VRTNLHRTSSSDPSHPASARPAGLPKLLTLADVADRLNTSERHIRRLVFERRIPYRKIGKFVRFHPDDLAEYIASQRVGIGESPTVGRLHPRRGGG